MEITCSRCHHAVQAENCYCAVCGLPQLVYAAEDSTGPGQPERWSGPVRDAGTVDWRTALRFAAILSIPTGILCSVLSPVSIFGFLLMAGAAVWVVMLYLRGQRPAWITMGAGARIGLVTGLLGGWVAAATTGVSFFAMRYWLHMGGSFDDFWLNLVNQQLAQQTSAQVDAQTVAMFRGWMLSPEGRAGWVLAIVAVLLAALMVSATVGGVVGARLIARARRPEA